MDKETRHQHKGQNTNFTVSKTLRLNSNEGSQNVIKLQMQTEMESKLYFANKQTCIFEHFDMHVKPM